MFDCGMIQQIITQYFLSLGTSQPRMEARLRMWRNRNRVPYGFILRVWKFSKEQGFAYTIEEIEDGLRKRARIHDKN